MPESYYCSHLPVFLFDLYKNVLRKTTTPFNCKTESVFISGEEGNKIIPDSSSHQDLIRKLCTEAKNISLCSHKSFKTVLVDKEHFEEDVTNWSKWDLWGAQRAGIQEDLLGPPSNPKPMCWVGVRGAPRPGGKFPWSKGTAVSRLSEGAMLVKAFRHMELMSMKSCEDESPED